MKRQLGPILAAVALLCAPLAWSQSSVPDSTLSTSSDPSPGASTDAWQSGSPDGLPQSGSADTSQSGLAGPQDTFSHPEKLPPLNLFGEALAHTGMTFTFGAGSAEQYVSSGGGYPGYWYNLGSFSGGTTIVQIRPTLVWGIGYNAGVNVTAGSSSYNYTELNQAANGRILWQLGKRWQFRVRDSYFYTDDPFQPFFTYLGQPTPNNPNPVLYFPNSVVEQNNGTADLTYMLGARDLVDFYGSESFQRFLRGNVETPTTVYNPYALWNSITYSGGGFYQHEFSPKLAAGEGYVFTAMDFGHGESRAGVQTFQTFVNYKVSSRMVVSGWIGPELTGTKDIVPLLCLPNGCLVEIQHNSYFNLAEGGTLSWAMGRGNSLNAQVGHSITNGGGLFGAVKFYQATVTYARPLTRRWNLAAGFLYGDSTSVSIYQGSQYLHSIQGTVSVARQLKESWNISAYYAFIKQTESYYAYYGLPPSYTTNGLGLTVRYVWNRALGR